MRTAIIFAGLFIANAIYPNQPSSNKEITAFLAILIIIMIMMDLFEFLKNMCKK